jgi:hypothetical protein
VIGWVPISVYNSRMTDEERYVTQGRTRDALKRSREIVGTLRADISAHATKLKEASEHLTSVLTMAPKPGPTGMTPAQYFVHFYASFVTPDIAAKLDHLQAELRKLEKLEKEVKEFE